MKHSPGAVAPIPINLAVLSSLFQNAEPWRSRTEVDCFINPASPSLCHRCKCFESSLQRCALSTVHFSSAISGFLKRVREPRRNVSGFAIIGDKISLGISHPVTALFIRTFDLDHFERPVSIIDAAVRLILVIEWNSRGRQFMCQPM